MSESRNPVRRSALYDRLLEAGAVMQKWGQWCVASHFGDVDAEAEALRSKVGLSDRSFLPKWQIEGKDLSQVAVDLVEGEAPAVGSLVETGEACVLRITDHRMLMVIEREEASDFVGRLSGTNFDSGCAHLLERTNGIGILGLYGPYSREVLRRLTSLDLREQSFGNLRCASAPVAGVAAILLRRDRRGVLGYEIWFDWYYGVYIWDVALQAGKEFSIRPIGVLAENGVGSRQGSKV